VFLSHSISRPALSQDSGANDHVHSAAAALTAAYTVADKRRRKLIANGSTRGAARAVSAVGSRIAENGFDAALPAAAAAAVGPAAVVLVLADGAAAGGAVGGSNSLTDGGNSSECARSRAQHSANTAELYVSTCA
jgi:hypothetical protein